MAKALQRIKTGKGQIIKPGEDVPQELADKMPWAVEQAFTPTLNPADQRTLVGAAAARESILTRPDNPNRPPSVQGESKWKVNEGGAFGSKSPSPFKSSSTIPDAGKVQAAKPGQTAKAATAKPATPPAPAAPVTPAVPAKAEDGKPVDGK